jgi:hypothetical protein
MCTGKSSHDLDSAGHRIREACGHHTWLSGLETLRARVGMAFMVLGQCGLGKEQGCYAGFFFSSSSHLALRGKLGET